ncbi:NAD(P)/FAD-dependent oxidoreductase [Mucisphaera sp.]|uniref:NAD(P)/FAD-dependent oxidoreductase n=1 Tax=Mucisphaera sp. TaxID=2913024 RepID=UPI003D0CC147
MVKDVLIIGAGVAGSAAGRLLKQAGLSCTVYDKGRGPGGRASTRQRDLLAFDHGVQYLSAKSAAFAEALRAWEEAGVIGLWDARFARVESGALEVEETGGRYVGLPAMNRVVGYLQDDVDVAFGQAVTSLARHDDGWCARLEDETVSEAHRAVLLALPAPQAAQLLGPVHSGFAEAAGRCEMKPNWTLMVAFEEQTGWGFDAVRWEDHASAGWLACNSSKPGRPTSGPECWVFQAAEPWTREYLELDREAAVEPLMGVLRETLGELGLSVPETVHARAHRWRYAFSGDPVGQACLDDAAASLTVCGDWLLGDRVESAYLSGLAGAEAILGRLV